MSRVSEVIAELLTDRYAMLRKLADAWDRQALEREAIWLQDPVAATLKHAARQLRETIETQERTPAILPHA